MFSWLFSSIGKKYVMAATGFFLISFLIVHCGINSMIYFNDGGETFLHYAHIMGTNLIIHFLEAGLFAGIILHIGQGLYLYFQNRKARPVAYAKTDGAANSNWYSRSMTLLGTLILFFLIIHLADFWAPNRSAYYFGDGERDLFQMMRDEFQELWVVLVYIAGCISLAWHLVHGFKSAFQSFGLNHTQYNAIILYSGYTFSVVITLLFISMPLSFYFGLIQ